MAEKTAHFKYFGNPEGLDTRGLPVRVLVVDDEELTRKLIVQVLKSVGYDVVGEAENGKEAIEQFKKASGRISPRYSHMERSFCFYCLR